MSNVTKFITGAVVLIIAVLLCAVYITGANKGRGSINQSMESYDDMIGQLSDTKFSTYADATASGSDIINLIKNLKASDGVNVIVTNKSGTVVTYSNAAGTITGKDTTGTTYTLADISDKNKTASYINSLASFDGSLTRDANGAITSVNFVQR